MTGLNRPTWVEVDLGIIRRNVQALKRLAGVPLMAVVKANAYGHGAVPVARAAAEAGAEWCGVAFTTEGIELVQAGVRARVLALGYTPPTQAAEAIATGLSLAVVDSDVATAYAAIAGAQGRRVNVHVKVDTGMGRLGVPVDQAADFVRQLSGLADLHVEGIFTHFATADTPSAEAITGGQLREFAALIEGLTASGLRPSMAHAANSAALITLPDSRFDLVRPGISVYGLRPSIHVALPQGVRPALAWKSSLSSVRAFPPGAGISYGHDYLTQGHERIGVVPLGYGDGYRRIAGANRLLVRGSVVPVVGRVCMDQVMVQLDGVPDARRDDEVVLIGEQNGSAITAEDVAAAWGTISYEVVCGIMDRVPRLYVNG